MKPAISLALIITVVTSIQAMKLNFTDCGSYLGEIHSLEVNPCTSDPCVLKRGDNMTSVISFTPHEQVSAAKIDINAIIAGSPIHVHIPNPNACDGHGLKCPLEKGKKVELVVSQVIRRSAPPGRYRIRTELKEQYGIDVFCDEIRIHLT
ncbi:NPC intracellular cholesterol transporter 2 [Exaiptasia diaphana]|uniref:MD-2-related lipid-recognition domain-containing protein n=1 Tax=Exaiptasia diaphana TaxID=2652724 RepID=A0A913XPE1_EXADI|nr:NPC intracellular cholesterol transporter 2 [Exaiptasia diaphana]